ncbi:hypothetical protein [Sulfoacidibacillus ferrooxidans]|uniref:Uncharacterized protein n=1 Tax=Sulfoacidibacillus ferrooxidans TaxID=2005001 RepID=A0A9X1VB64_9BACL|nr:hypothetical protein [Sulfoacidibacillus ferrooxidans]MCI0184634.1 hypothetical protein [Sulfoacidibacillus ferrooxidans]
MNDMSKMMDMSVSRIKEHERLLSLTISLQNMVRNRIISVRAGSNLSSLPVEAQDWFQESHKEATEIKDTEVTAAIMLWKQKEQEQRTIVDHDAYLNEEEQDDDLNSSLLTQEVRKAEVFDGQLHDVQADAKRQKYQLPEDKKVSMLDLNNEETQYRYSENLMEVKLRQAETTIKRIKSEFEVLMQEHSDKFNTPRTYWHSQLDKYVQTVEEFADVVLSYKQDVSELKNSV